MKYRYTLNPFSGNFEQVAVPPSTQETISSILVSKDEETGQVRILFDEDSILHVDDDYIA